MRYLRPVEYDVEHDRTIVRGINYSLNPYTIEIQGGEANVWADILSWKKIKLKRAIFPRVNRPKLEEEC